jgi:maltose alpha-D-glucosyltransferase/alpha-amylase
MSPEGRNEYSTEFDQLPLVRVPKDWNALLDGDSRAEFERLLPDFLMQRRWFGGKGRKISSVTVSESVAIPHDNNRSYLVLLEVRYEDDRCDLYLLGLSFVPSDRAAQVLTNAKDAVLRVASDQSEGVVYDAVRDRGFVIALLDSIDRESTFTSDEREIAATHTEKFDELRSAMSRNPTPRVMGAEQSNTSVVFGERLIMKLFRRLESGVNPDFEIGRFLTEHGFFNTPPVAGAIEMSPPNDEEEPLTLGILQGFVPNQGDAWKYTLESVDATLKKALDQREQLRDLRVPDRPLFELANDHPPALLTQLAGDYLDSVRLLGRRTAEMHVTLDSHTDGEQPNFDPEEFSRDYQRAVYNSMRRLAGGVLAMLRQHLNRLPPHEREQAQQLLTQEGELNDAYHAILESDFDAERTRIHGDYHLGQVLYTGSDFVIIDFEGEPMRSMKERRVKQSPLRDVAGMLRSFDYAGNTGLARANASGEDRNLLVRFARTWVAWVSAAFLSAYFETAKQARFMPADRQLTATLLDVFLLDKAIYELGYELNNRPTWVGIPISGILGILEQRAKQRGVERRVA